MKKTILITLLSIPLALSNCGSNDNYQRCNSIRIAGGGEVTNQEPTKYVYAEYEVASSLDGYTTQGYGDEHKTVYVYTIYSKTYEAVGFKENATLNAYTTSGTTVSIDAKLKGLVALTNTSTEVYYAKNIRTIKVVEYNNYIEKAYDGSKCDEMKTKLCYFATVSESSTIISEQGYSYYNYAFNPKKQETYTDLGTTAVSYTPYEKPETTSE